MRRWGLLTLITVHCLIHLIIYDRSPLQFDELLTINLVKDLDFSHLISFLMIDEIQMPLQYVLIKIFSLISLESWVLRLPSLFLTLSLPYIIYKTARMSLSGDQALKASWLVSFSLPVLVYSHSLRPYILLLIAFCWSVYQLRLQKSNPKLALALLILFLSHPIGVVSSTLLSLTFFLNNKKKAPLPFKIFSLAGFIFLAVFLFSRWEIIKSFSLQKLPEQWINYCYKFSFLTSGMLFSSLFFILLLYLLSRKSRKKDFESLDRFNLLWFGLPIILSFIALPFLDPLLQPRHLIMIVPPLAFLTMELIELIPSLRIQKIFFGLALTSLLIKGFYIDRIQDTAYEIESSLIAKELTRLSQSTIPIVNCGNCLSYYIKSDLLICLGSKYDYQKLTHITGKFLYLELDFVEESCGLKKLDRRIINLKSYPFKGGTIHLLDRSSLQGSML